MSKPRSAVRLRALTGRYGEGPAGDSRDFRAAMAELACCLSADDAEPGDTDIEAAAWRNCQVTWGSVSKDR